MTPLEALARRVEKAIPKVIQGANKVGRDTVKDVRDFAIYFSSGTFSSAQLAAMNHPYGKGFASVVTASGPRFGQINIRGPIPYGDPSIINKQTGEFRSDWVMYSVGSYKGSGLTVYGVKNTDTIASFLQFGTVKMIARPLDKAMRVYMDQVYAKRLADTIPPLLKGLI